jgi:tRNA(His) guanylyltransferase
MSHKGDSLGDRMKKYEDVPRLRLTRRVPVMMRLDGKAFHTFTKNLPRPYHRPFHECMWEAAKYLCEEIQGAQLAYVQSDEITILITDYADITTEAWYDYQVQKMASVAAAMCTAAFMRAHIVHSVMNDKLFRPEHKLKGLKLPAFDARVWNLPKDEVTNAFIWRQQDATRNAIQSLGQAELGHKAMQGLNNELVQEKLHHERGINFNNLPVPQKRGVCIVKQQWRVLVPEGAYNEGLLVKRTRWVVDENIPIFTQDRAYIEKTL